jgi:PAS domain S-box-containing protein
MQRLWTRAGLQYRQPSNPNARSHVPQIDRPSRRLPRLTFSLPLEPARLIRARQRIRDYLFCHGASSAGVEDIVLAIEEAMTNAVRHSRVSGNVEVRMSFDGPHVLAEVEDHGVGFDVAGFDRSAEPSPLAPGGRGLYLIARLMDELDLRSDGGLTVRCLKRDVLSAEAMAANEAEMSAICVPGYAVGMDERQRALLDEIEESFIALDWDYRYVHLNDAALRLVGKPLEQILGQRPQELLPHYADSDQARAIRDAMELGRASVVEFEGLDGWLEARVYPTSSGVSVFGRDITVRKRGELERDVLHASLRDSEQRQAFLLRHAPAAIYEMDYRRGRFVTVNEQMCAVTGYSREELLAMDPLDLLAGEDRAVFAERIRRLLAGEPDESEAQYRVVTKQGEERHAIVNSSPVIEDGKPVGAFVVALDVTDLKLAEAELRWESGLRQLALDSAGMGWWQYDPATQIASYDEGYRRIFGVTGSSRPNEEILKRLHPVDLPHVWSQVEAALDPADPKPYATEYRIVMPDGETRWIEAHGVAAFEGFGDERRATNFVGTVMDITERKLSEADRRALIDRLQTQTEELQAQGEELQAQSEELQVQTEELQVQTEELQVQTEELNRQAEDLSARRDLAVALNAINDRVHSTMEPDEILQAALDEGVRAMRLDAGAIEVREAECWTVRYQCGFSAADVGVCLSESEAPNATRVMRERELLATADIALDPGANVGFVRHHALRSVLAVPLVARDAVIGCLLLYGRKVHGFTGAELDFGRSLGATVSQAIENARLFEAEAAARVAMERELDATMVLLDAARTVISLTDLDSTLGALADLVVRSTDHARVVVELWHEERREIEVVASSGALAIARERFPFASLSEAMKEAMRARETHIIDYALTGALPLDAYRSRHAFLRVLVVPIVYRDRLVGLIAVDEPGERRPFDQREIRLVEAIAAQAGASIANAQLYDAQREIAVRLQENFVHPLPVVPGLDLAAVSLPAAPAELVGGDFHDVFVLADGRIVALIADVMGKGIKAAGLTETVRSSIRTAALIDPSLEAVMRHVNGLLLQEPAHEPLVTVLLLVLDTTTGQGELCSAGHPPPAHVSARGVRLLEPAFGAPLGAFDEPYRQTTFELAPGEALVLFTDGVTEARCDGEQFGEERLQQALAGSGAEDSQALAHALRDEVVGFADALKDDVQILVVRRLP